MKDDEEDIIHDEHIHDRRAARSQTELLNKTCLTEIGFKFDILNSNGKEKQNAS